uniref:Antennal gustatory receptor 4 n=1 Tax=Dendrolimus punctatus TaxID=238572 RepID=A0A2K8GKV7_9NEOP|nr:antennal gustatory receptor 4 [Dendrolimus punctatus]
MKLRSHHSTLKRALKELIWIYKKLICCGKYMSFCFSVQILLRLSLSFINYIAFVMTSVQMLSEKKFLMLMDWRFLIIIGWNHIIMPYVVLAASQKVHNEYISLTRALARFCNTSVKSDNMEAYKITRNFKDFISRNPVQISLTQKLTIGMYLLPCFLSISISYTIVILQFHPL